MSVEHLLYDQLMRAPSVAVLWQLSLLDFREAERCPDVTINHSYWYWPRGGLQINHTGTVIWRRLTEQIPPRRHDAVSPGLFKWEISEKLWVIHYLATNVWGSSGDLLPTEFASLTLPDPVKYTSTTREQYWRRAHEVTRILKDNNL